jgi:glyoxylase-like metal-dependent hydrolase (beta-lactamase superfamily II)
MTTLTFERPVRVTPLLDGIWQIAGVARAAHAYLVRGSRRNILVDSGLPGSFDGLCAALATLGLAPSDLDLVVLTHEHIDHAGGAPRFARHCPIAAHRLAARKLALHDEFTMMNKAFAADMADFEIDLLLEEGCRIDAGGGRTLHVLHTPGHCSGAICLLDAGHRALISADTIMAGGVVGGVLGSGNVSDYIASLERLALLRIDHLLPGHGRISHDAASDIAAGLERLHGLLDDSQALFSLLRETDRGFDDVMRSLRDLNSL